MAHNWKAASFLQKIYAAAQYTYAAYADLMMLIWKSNIHHEATLPVY